MLPQMKYNFGDEVFYFCYHKDKIKKMEIHLIERYDDRFLYNSTEEKELFKTKKEVIENQKKLFLERQEDEKKEKFEELDKILKEYTERKE